MIITINEEANSVKKQPDTVRIETDDPPTQDFNIQCEVEGEDKATPSSAQSENQVRKTFLDLSSEKDHSSAVWNNVEDNGQAESLLQ